MRGVPGVGARISAIKWFFSGKLPELGDSERGEVRIKVRDKRMKELEEHYQRLNGALKLENLALRKALGHIENLEANGYQIREVEIPKGVGISDAFGEIAANWVKEKWGPQAAKMVKGVILENKNEIDMVGAQFIQKSLKDVLGKAGDDTKVGELKKALGV